jgi:sulfotransferase 6B1
MRLPRTVARLRANDEEYGRCPPILVNSLPKSGTHLLLQIVRALPNTRYYGTFIAQRPSTSTHLRSQRAINHLIEQIVPGEVVPAHLHYSPETVANLERQGVLHIFIHRDPKAVILSEVAYLSKMAPWNALSRRFSMRQSMEDRVTLAIEGDGTPEYPNAAERFSPFLAWVNNPSTLCVTYENLIAPDRRNGELRRIVEAFLRRTSAPKDEIEELVGRLSCAIDPQSSHTYRSKRSGSSQTILSPKNRQRLNKILTQLE